MTRTKDNDSWEASWEVEFPATNREELLLALVVRDLLHGASFDVEAVSAAGGDLAMDYAAGDEIEGQGYILLVTVEVTGPRDHEAVQEITEQLLEQLVDEAEELVGKRQLLGTAPLGDVVFEAIPEEDERWDLVMADWLAPDGAAVPFGFRSFRGRDGDPWPSDGDLDSHGRIVAVPFAGNLSLFAIPAPAMDTEDDLARGVLPIVP